MMNTTAAAGAFCFAIDDETTKLAILTVFVRKTVGLQRMTPTPALCRLFMEGRCRQSSQCHQIHADVHVVEQLRREVLAAPPCCQMHTPHVVQTLAGCDLSWFVDVCGEAVPVALFCPTVGLRKCIDAHSTACAADLCRSHSSGALCRYGEDCNFLHVCPAMAEERFSAVAPSSRPRPYEERRVNSDSDSIKFRGESKEATTAPYHRRYHPNRVFRDPKSDQRELLMTAPHNAHNAAAMNSFLFHVVVPSPAASFMGAISDATTKATTTVEEEDSCPLPFACSGVFGEEDSLSDNDGDGLLARNVKGGDGALFEEGGGLSMASSFCHGASNSLSSFYYSAASTNSPNKTCSTHHCVSPTCTTVIASRWSHNPYAKWFGEGGETRTPCVCI